MTFPVSLPHHDGYVFTCLDTGEITQVLLPLSDALPVGGSLLDLTTVDDRESARLFLHTLTSLAFTADWPLSFMLPAGQVSCHLAGAHFGSQNVVIATIVDDHAPSPAPLDAATRSASADMALLDEFSRINNELINTKRSLVQTSVMLEHQLDQYRITLERIRDAVIVVGPSCDVRFLNPSAETLLEWTADAALKQPLTTVLQVFDEASDEVMPLVRAEPGSAQALATGAHEGRLNTPSGLQIPVALSVVALSDSQPNPLGWVITVYDLRLLRQTLQQEVELALEQERGRLLSGFIRNTSHDLKTPLAVLNTSTYLLRRLTDPERIAAQLDLIEQQVLSLGQTIDQIHLLVSLDAGLDLMRVPSSVTELLNNAVAKLQPLAQANGVSTVVEAADRDFTLPLDAHHFAIALHALVENAIRFTPAGGTVHCAIDRQNDATRISICDTGIGIEEQHLPRIFERFYKADPARTHTGGAGIGLSIALLIVRAHAGTIDVTSTPNEGSCFTVYLPDVESTA